MAFASEAIIDVYNKVKPPYNINQATQELALKALEETGQVNDMIRALVSMREQMHRQLAELPVVRKIYPSDANFLLVKVDDARAVYQYLLDQGIVVRDRSKVDLCEGCLRITVGTESENGKLLKALGQYQAI
jgi:histidinol-phosphate aminotransferase